MQINQLQTKRKSKKRIARGGKRGAYCGQGMNGQNCRAGARKQPLIRQILKRYHKLRGYSFSITRAKPISINLTTIEKHFDEKMILSPLSLVKSKILGRIDNKLPKVKILGTGELKKKLKVSGCLVSKTAKEKIEKAGGTVIEEKLSRNTAKKVAKEIARKISKEKFSKKVEKKVVKKVVKKDAPKPKKK